MISLADYLEVEHIYSQTCAKGLRSISICAANPQEGVSTLACALAERHQMSGKRTLLVDMNYFRPSLDERYQLPRLNWSAEPESCARAVLNEVNGVHILTASSSLDMQLRQTDALQTLIAGWMEQYDAVIIDTSPINAINRHNVPAELVCARTLATVMVVRSGITPQGDILNALTKLNQQGVTPIGLVMNDVDCPSLYQEMIRELDRLARFAPGTARKLSQWIAKNKLINQRI